MLNLMKYKSLFRSIAKFLPQKTYAFDEHTILLTAEVAFSSLQVLASILSQAIIIIQFKSNENNDKSPSGYRSGWNMEGLMENRILSSVTTDATTLQKDSL